VDGAGWEDFGGGSGEGEEGVGVFVCEVKDTASEYRLVMQIGIFWQVLSNAVGLLETFVVCCLCG
jgi:hypothetical protein